VNFNIDIFGFVLFVYEQFCEIQRNKREFGATKYLDYVALRGKQCTILPLH